MSLNPPIKKKNPVIKKGYAIARNVPKTKNNIFYNESES